MDVVRTVNEANLILPAGDVKIGPYDYNLYANSQINAMEDINQVPLKTVGDASVLVADVGKAEDASQIQYNMVRVDGQPRSICRCSNKAATPTRSRSSTASRRASPTCWTCRSNWSPRWSSTSRCSSHAPSRT